MEERFGQYGITRRQRISWLSIIVFSCALGVVLAALALAGAIRGNDTLIGWSAPLAGMFISFGVLIGAQVLSGSPPNGSAERERTRATQHESSRRLLRRMLSLYGIVGAIGVIWFLIAVAFRDDGHWHSAAPLGLVGVVLVSIAIVGWWWTSRSPRQVDGSYASVTPETSEQ